MKLTLKLKRKQTSGSLHSGFAQRAHNVQRVFLFATQSHCTAIQIYILPSSRFIVNIFLLLPSYLNRCTLARALNLKYNAANRIQSCYESGPSCPYSIYLFHYCVNHTNTVLECACGIFFTKTPQKFSSTIAFKLCMRLVEVFCFFCIMILLLPCHSSCCSLKCVFLTSLCVFHRTESFKRFHKMSFNNSWHNYPADINQF